MKLRRWQHGDTLGTLVIIAIAIAAGYYIYTEVMLPEPPRSCKGVLNACNAKCNRTATEAPAMQACNAGCMRDFQACEGK